MISEEKNIFRTLREPIPAVSASGTVIAFPSHSVEHQLAAPAGKHDTDLSRAQHFPGQPYQYHCNSLGKQTEFSLESLKAVNYFC